MLAILLVATTLGGCQLFAKVQQHFQLAETIATKATEILVSKDFVTVAVSGFNAAKVTATIYLEQKRCPKGIERPDCRSPRITQQIKKFMAEGTRTRDELLTFAEKHQGEGDPNLFNDLQAIAGSLRSTLAAYGVGGQS